MNAADRLPADQKAREFITTELEQSIFVAAAAGSGKTKSMVDRILKLIDAGKDVDQIAAVTFTERAASELRDRIRRSLHDTQNEASATEEVRALRRAALHKIDGAMIGTLHGFAYRLLAENPIEAGLPVVFSVRDEATSEAMRAAEWEIRLGGLVADTELAEDFRVLSAAGAYRDLLKQAAETLDNQWDLVRDVFKAEPRLDHLALLARPIELAHELLDMLPICADVEDKAYVGISEGAGAFIDRAKKTESLGETIELLGSPRVKIKGGNIGTKGNWGEHIDEMRETRTDFNDARTRAKEDLLESSARRVIAALAQGVVQAAENRIEAGQVTYDDLLVLTRRMLREQPAVRRRLHERYRHILIDEFQDTDPLQLAITLLIAADPDAGGELDELMPLAGGVFLVGDPQQSIYAFRGADLKLYLSVQDRVKNETSFATAQSLSVNFRTVEGVIDWVNATFEGLIKPRAHSQPQFSPLSAHRVGEQLAGPPVAVLGEAYDVKKIGEVRTREAEDIAATIVDAVGNWDVFDDETKEVRKARLGDIAVLSWGRGRYPVLMDALDAAEIPYRAESASLTYSSQEVRALLHTLRAVDDPSDDFSLVLALRSVLFGCGDDDLLAAKQALGYRRIKIGCDLEALPEASPVRESLEYLAELRGLARTASPSELLEWIADDRRLMELAHADRRPRDLWRRVRSVVDQAREWTAAVGGSLADYLEWAASKVEDSKKAVEAILPETDDDAVQLQVIHSAKGLEYPIVILFDLGAGENNKKDPKVLIDGQRWEFRLTDNVMSRSMRDGKDELKAREYDERMRMLYVACTRARDHLVVCTHRKKTKTRSSNPTLAVVMAEGSAADHVEDFAPERGRVFTGAVASGERAELMPLDEWTSRHELVRAAAELPEAIAVTDLIREETAIVRTPRVAAVVQTADITVDAGGAEDAVLHRRFGGPRFGSAVHAVLEEVAFDDPASVALHATRAAASEAIDSDAAAVAAAAKNALESSVLARAASATRIWRELFLAQEREGQVIEGIVDLLFEDAGGKLVIVDYKTDDLSPEDFAERASGHYGAQLSAYVELVQSVAGRTVDETWLLHLREDGVSEIQLS